MKIRPMSIEDYNEVYKLWTNTDGMGMRSLDDSPEGIDRFLRRNPSTCFIAQEGEDVIGVIFCGHDGRRGFIYHTAVKTDYRGRGIGRALVNAALEALKKEKINKVALVVFTSNNLGNRFWQSLGFDKRDDLVYRNLSINDNNV